MFNFLLPQRREHTTSKDGPGSQRAGQSVISWLPNVYCWEELREVHFGQTS
jgi:hypothetical protein